MVHILEVEQLTKKYPDFTLDKVNFSIPQGTIMGLIGENGAGKTTTMNLILNEMRKDGGKITIFGKDHLEHERAVKEKIGVVFDECHFPELFSANEMEQVMKGIYTTWQPKAYRDYLKRFELPPDKKNKAFSKGMKVKLAFAVALSHQPQLLLLDEATSGLDPVMRDEILDILLEFVQDETHGVLFSSHITDDLEKIADYITFIHKGKLLLSKTKDELIYDYGVIKCGMDMFNDIDKSDIIAYRKQDYEWQVLVANKEDARRKYKNCLIDNATINEIMLFHVKGEKEKHERIS